VECELERELACPRSTAAVPELKQQDLGDATLDPMQFTALDPMQESEPWRPLALEPLTALALEELEPSTALDLEKLEL